MKRHPRPPLPPIQLSSDEDEDFAPPKLRSRRISIVLNKKPVKLDEIRKTVSKQLTDDISRDGIRVIAGRPSPKSKKSRDAVISHILESSDDSDDLPLISIKDNCKTSNEKDGPVTEKKGRQDKGLDNRVEGSSSSVLGYIFCDICKKNMTGYNLEKRRKHVNMCCDKLEKLNNFGSNSTKESVSKGKQTVLSRFSCPLCPKSYRDNCSLKRHMKACCEAHNKCYDTVLQEFSLVSKKLKTAQKKSEKLNKAKRPPALLVEKESALNDAQNRILDLIVQDSSTELTPTPTLMNSRLKTFKSKRNSIWNLAGNSATVDTNILNADSSETNICMDKTTLPSQADFTQLTQFLKGLGKDGSMKERISSLMVASPVKVPELEDSEHKDVKIEDETQQIVRDPVVQIKNTFKEVPSESFETPGSPKIVLSIKSVKKIISSPLKEESSDPESDLEIVKEKDASKESHAEFLVPFDRSPNPSEISANTPGRTTSEMVSTLRGPCSTPDDSNVDLFIDEDDVDMDRGPSSNVPEEFDRSLMNVSPITDTGYHEEEQQKKHVPSSSPVYRPKICSSTTTALNKPDTDKSVQVSSETKTALIQATHEMKVALVGTEVQVRAQGTTMESITTSSRGTGTDVVDRSTTSSQCDGDNQLLNMLRRLLVHSPSSDLALVCSDRTKLAAHRAILLVSCPGLLDQSSAGEVELGVSRPAGVMFLEFLYTRRIECEVVEESELKELQDLAKRFNLSELTLHLNTKKRKTIEIKFESQYGGTVCLNLSSQDLLNLSSRVDQATVSLSQTLGSRSASPTKKEEKEDVPEIDCSGVLNNDFPSFQEHHLPSQEVLKESPPMRSIIPLQRSPGQRTQSDDDLPCSGLVIDEKDVKMTDSAEAKRDSQFSQDVEFIELVKNMDDPVNDSPLSFIDRLSPIRFNTPDIQTTSTPQYPLHNGVDSPFTPRALRNLDLSEYKKTPGFTSMDTPRLRTQVEKYGLKPLSKKRAVAKLEEIHRFTNKKFLKCPTETTDKPSDSRSQNRKNKAPARASRKRKSSSSSDSSVKECPVGDITISEKLPKSSLRDVDVLVKSGIMGNPELRRKVLQYEAVDIIEIKGLLKRRTSVGLIAQALDDQGITYFNSETKSRGYKGKAGKRPRK